MSQIGQSRNLYFLALYLNKMQKPKTHNRNIKYEINETQLFEIIKNTNNGLLDKAFIQCRELIEIHKNSPILFNIMGAILRGQGKLKESLDAYQTALSLDSDDPQCYNNKAITELAIGNTQSAIMSYVKALELKPDFNAALNNLGNALKDFEFNSFNPEVENAINLLLDREIRVRPSEITDAVLSLLRSNPMLLSFLTLDIREQNWEHVCNIVETLSNSPLLLKFMSISAIPDVIFEKQLTELRSKILYYIDNLEDNPNFLIFQKALALHCFTNEYIFHVGEDDKAIALELGEKVAIILDQGGQPSPHLILCLASFMPLHTFHWIGTLQVCEKISAVYRRQVIEPEQEKAYKSKIKSFSSINDDVSRDVMVQYEESPYPRWINLGLRLFPTSIDKLAKELNIRLDEESKLDFSAPKILVAGCGTGQQPIGTATSFLNSEVTAIDLSTASLAYAKRRTDELDIQNINYFQGDILELGNLNQTFDMIECTGVLHHMSEPMNGWQKLTECLKPGGIMIIGLYSRLARQRLSIVKNKLSKLNLKASDENIRNFRYGIMTDLDAAYSELLSSVDFYSMSNFRDLFFHVKEHTFSLPEIQKSLDDLDLQFCGFTSKRAVSKFLESYGTDYLYDLEKWCEFEINNPQTFSEMYQFWCQKAIA